MPDGERLPAGTAYADHRRDREAGRLVYPVLSRRSGGLSVGVNLFPDAKACSFDCPYCEVFPFAGAAPFSATELRSQLADFLDGAYPSSWAPEPVRDLCLSGNGEPSLSPSLAQAIAACSEARRARPALLGRAALVLITNSTGFLDEGVAALLHRAARDEGLEIWAKLDGADEPSFRRMSRSRFALGDIVDGIRRFAARSPLWIQTMLCEADGLSPGGDEALRLGELVASLAAGGAAIRGMQLYTQARPSPEGSTAPLADAELARLAALVRSRLPPGMPLRAFGRGGELAPLPGPAP